MEWASGVIGAGIGVGILDFVEDMSWTQFANELNRLWIGCKEVHPQKVSGTLLDTFKLTVIGCLTPAFYEKVMLSSKADYHADSAKYLEQLNAKNKIGKDVQETVDSTSVSIEHTGYEITARETVVGRRLFMSSRGYIGLDHVSRNWATALLSFQE
jgi:hypothetical protein